MNRVAYQISIAIKHCTEHDGRMKICPRCKQSDASVAFYSKGSYCKPCARELQRQWALSNRTRKLDINRAWRQRNRDRRKMIMDAGNSVWSAIRAGKLVRGASCEFCHSTRNIEAAHTNYSDPLNVRWLCRHCHRQWDAAHPKSLYRVKNLSGHSGYPFA